MNHIRINLCNVTFRADMIKWEFFMIFTYILLVFISNILLHLSSVPFKATLILFNSNKFQPLKLIMYS